MWSEAMDKIIEKHNAVAAIVPALTYDELATDEDFEIDDSDRESVDASIPSFTPPCDPEFETRMEEIRRKQLYFFECVAKDL